MTNARAAARPSRGLQFKLLGATSLGLVLLVAGALAGLASAWFDLGSAMPASYAVSRDADALRREFRVQLQEWKNLLLRGADPLLLETHRAALLEEGRKVRELAQAVDRAADPRTRELTAAFLAQHHALEADYQAALQAFIASGHDPVAGDTLVRGRDRPVALALDTLAEHTARVADADIAARSAHARELLVISAIATLVMAALLLAVLAWWLRRAVVRPVLAVEAAARAVAAGDLDHRVDTRGGDEIGRLARAMRDVQGTLRGVLDAQLEMARSHEAGQISHRMDDSAFPGAYGRMVADCNTLVEAHIRVKMRAIAVMSRYAVGDLSEDMERLPGEKRVITDALDMAKANLGAINAEIKRLAGAAAAGDFSLRGDQQRFDHDFRTMISTLNQLMQGTEHDLGKVSDMLRAIAGGDLRARMHGDFQGVFARIADDANATAGQLTTIVSGIKQATNTITDAATEIASGNSELSQRTEQQAANLEETAASMEELTSTVRQNAEHARHANGLAAAAADVAARGGAVVSEVVGTMADIEASSRQISEIISVIDGIAFQTNILALNAAVEAARAGDQGRGFAVVASEVRSLAQRSAAAAQEIKALIGSSVTKVADGALLVRQAGETMNDIVSSVQRVTDIMADITAASQEQSAGIEQVNQTVVQMDGATQQNAALVEEASAAARSLEQQALLLGQAVGAFRLDDRVASPSPPPMRRAAYA